MRSFFVLTIVAVALASPARTYAATIHALTGFTGVGVGYVSPVGSSAPGVTPVLGPVSFDASALGYAAVIEAYCVDIVGAFNGPGDYDATPALMTAWTPTQDPSHPVFVAPPGAGGRAAWLFDTYRGTAASIGPAAQTSLQIAIWNVLYDTDDSVSDGAGAFYVSDDPNGVVDQANDWLATVDLHSDEASWLRVDLKTQSDPDHPEEGQDFMAPLPLAVPEPASMWLAGMGFAAVVSRRRRTQ